MIFEFVDNGKIWYNLEISCNGG